MRGCGAPLPVPEQRASPELRERAAPSGKIAALNSERR